MAAAVEVELEVTYLAKIIPEGLTDCRHTVIEDVYFPAAAPHAKTRVRRKGDKYEFTKKTQLDPSDAGNQQEQNVSLTAEEYQALAKGDGRRVIKTRYYLPYQGLTAEVDIFGGELEGLVVVEFEFDSIEAKNSFVMPDFCLADVTQDDIIAGGVLAGKSYADVAPRLTQYNYQPLHFQAYAPAPQ